ncbi:MAG TPA: hypothetical protein VNZ45_02775 [Bacteroidia bacterium]|nr:hypothetical protein [Bacteroidia bacterium]
MKNQFFTLPAILLSCIILFLFYGCDNTGCSYSPSANLTSSELAWLSCYSSTETLTFKNELGNTMNAVSSFGEETNAPEHSMEDKCDVGVQTGGSGLGFYNNSYTYFICGIQIWISHYYPDYPLNLNSACITCTNTYNTFKFSNYTPQNNVMINGKPYNGVYIVQMDSSKKVVGPYIIPYIWQVYYNQANGILQFNTGGGHTWTLQ